MKKRYKLKKEIPWLEVWTIIQFDTEYEEIWIESEANWYDQPTDWQYNILEEAITTKSTFLVEIE